MSNWSTNKAGGQKPPAGAVTSGDVEPKPDSKPKTITRPADKMLRGERDGAPYLTKG